MTGQTPPYGVPTIPGAAGTFAPTTSTPEYATRSYVGPPSPQRSPLAVLVAVGFVLVVAALAYLWHEQQAASLDPTTVAGLQGDIRSVQQQVVQLAQRPTQPPVDLAPLDARIRALETKPAPVIPPPPDVAAIVAPLLSPLAGRIDAFATQQKTALDGIAAQQKSVLDNLAAQQKATLDALASQQKATLDALTAQTKAAVAAFSGRIDALEKQAATSQQDAKALTAQTSKASQVQTASLALEAGEPLGSIPGAPPAVARFATTKPPTESGLRLSFPAAAQAAETAAHGPVPGQTLADRMWQNAQALVTVREGNQVLVGTTAATIIAKARSQLDAGDLAGTVATLKTLTGPAASAMADWIGQAQALLDARAGLAAMAHS